MMKKKTKNLLALLGGSVVLAVAGLGASFSLASRPANVEAAGTTAWSRVTSISVGDVVTLTAEGATKDSNGTTCTGAYFTGFLTSDASSTSNYAKGQKGTFSSGSFSASDAGELTVVAGSATSSYAFQYTIGGTNYYLSAVSGNYLNLTTSVAAASSWTLTVDGTNVKLFNAAQTTRYIRWNNSSPRFAAYTTAQTSVQLYKKGTTISVTSITGVASKPARILQNGTLLTSEVSLNVNYSDSTTGTIAPTSVSCTTTSTGTVTATAYYDTLSTTFEITVYAAHNGLTAENAFTCEEAVVHTKAADLVAATTYYITGLWYSTYSAYNTSYGNCSIYLCDAIADPVARRFEAYKMYSVVAPSAFTQTTSVTAFTTGSNFTVYNGTYETKQCFYLDPDNSAVDSFVAANMHTDVAYTDAGTGLCKSSNWYTTAKAAFNALSDRQRQLFVATSTQYSLYTTAGGTPTNYTNPYTRLVAWATANGETLNSSTNTFGAQSIVHDEQKDSAFDITLGGIILAAILAFGAAVLLKKKKHSA
jgi:hypothetical protein